MITNKSNSICFRTKLYIYQSINSLIIFVDCIWDFKRRKRGKTQSQISWNTFQNLKPISHPSSQLELSLPMFSMSSATDLRELLTTVNAEIEVELLGSQAEFSQLSNISPFTVDKVKYCAWPVILSYHFDKTSSVHVIDRLSPRRQSTRLRLQCQRKDQNFRAGLRKQEFLWNCPSIDRFSFPS